MFNPIRKPNGKRKPYCFVTRVLLIDGRTGETSEHYENRHEDGTTMPVSGYEYGKQLALSAGCRPVLQVEPIAKTIDGTWFRGIAYSVEK